MRHEAGTTRRDLLQTAGAMAMGSLAMGSIGFGADTSKPDRAVPFRRPEGIGIDSQRMQVAYDLLEKWTTGPDAPIPGGAIVAGRAGGGIVAPAFFGRMGPEAGASPIRPDAMFLMASITKPIVYLGAMLLVERGELNLNDRVTRYVPEFAAHGKEETLVFHLFTHTSGLPDMLPDNVELRKSHAPLSRFMEGASRDTVPLFKPGTQLSYQSMGTNVVADIIQRISGQTIAEYLKKSIFEPLGLNSTGLGSAGFDRERLVRVQTPDYQSGGTDFDWNSEYWQKLGAPWGGMFSTPEDFAVICSMLLSGGKWGKVQLVSPATIQMMATNRLDDLPDLPEPIRRTQPWGLGWRMNHPGTPGSWGDLLGRHVFGHTGATGTMVWMNPATLGFCILLTSGIREKAPWRLVHLSNIVASAFV